MINTNRDHIELRVSVVVGKCGSRNLSARGRHSQRSEPATPARSKLAAGRRTRLRASIPSPSPPPAQQTSPDSFGPSRCARADRSRRAQNMLKENLPSLNRLLFTNDQCLMAINCLNEISSRCYSTKCPFRVIRKRFIRNVMTAIAQLPNQ